MEQHSNAGTRPAKSFRLSGYFGLEINRRRKKLRAIFNVIEKRESAIAEVLEEMVEVGELKPFAWGDRI